MCKYLQANFLYLAILRNTVNPHEIKGKFAFDVSLLPHVEMTRLFRPSRYRNERSWLGENPFFSCFFNLIKMHKSAASRKCMPKKIFSVQEL